MLQYGILSFICRVFWFIKLITIQKGFLLKKGSHFYAVTKLYFYFCFKGKIPLTLIEVILNAQIDVCMIYICWHVCGFCLVLSIFNSNLLCKSSKNKEWENLSELAAFPSLKKKQKIQRSFIILLKERYFNYFPYFRSSHQRCSIKKVFFKISLVSQENTSARLHKCFPVNFVNFLRIPFLQNLSGRLLLLFQESLSIGRSAARTPANILDGELCSNSQKVFFN